ncbi:MAG: o-succinylbenzoate synthase [Acidobacteria bacterium]|nr:o-succinylbenzoate synthase [Acidobacteriota bacterium]
MNIDRITLREIRMTLKHPFETSFGVTHERRVLLVEVESGGVSGWGEATVKTRPLYNEEFVDASWALLRDVLGPKLRETPVEEASELVERFGFIRGHRMTRAALETAAWDLEARLAGEPLWQHIGGSREIIDCGVSIGIQASVEKLIEKIQTELDAGYQRIKIKIKPGWDVDVVAQVRERFPDILLSVDANSAYRLSDAPLLKRLDDYNLLMIEQPLADDDIIDHAKLQAMLETRLCLDESIRSARHAEQAIEAGACRIINIKLGRVGGFSEAILVHNVARAHQVPVWCGGMLESGIGRAHNIAMSTLGNFSLPGDVSASQRYWNRDIITPEVTVSPVGTITPPTGPGLGFEVDREYLESLVTRREVLE